MNEKNRPNSRLRNMWPQKKWKKIVLAMFLLLISVGVPILAYFEYSVYREVVTPLDIMNPEATKTALLVYHPGLTSFSHDVTYSFANGLATSGWRVEISTASPKTPRNLTRYDLLVLSWPIYDLYPGPTITNYVNSIGNLQGVDTIVITIGGGINPLNCQDMTAKTVQNSNGTLKDSLTAFRGGHAVDDMYAAATRISP
jgi:hypothetical protein